MPHALMAISPVDGRYEAKTTVLAPYVSEFGLIKYRLLVMVEHLIGLSQEGKLPLRRFNDEEVELLWSIPQSLTLADAEIVKAIETTGYGPYKRTNHDVKACEYYLRLRLENTSLVSVLEWIHFGCTSEDVNNIAQSCMLKHSFVEVVWPVLDRLITHLEGLAVLYADLSMLARTHGQPASPTTFGKEFRVFSERVKKQALKLRRYRFAVKLNGASGNYDAFVAAFPEVDWGQYTKNYVEGFNARYQTNFEVNLYSTQIESHDSWAEFFQCFALLNTILIGFDQDVWRYVSDDWLVQKPVAGEVGSSAMPHKVNPIDLENSEGNLGVANALFTSFAAKLPISRLQRDLSDSTVERNFGVAFAHALIAYESILKGLGKIAVNEAKVREVLDEHPEVLTEAYQTILRSVNYPDPYGVMKDLARGKKIRLEDLHALVGTLEVEQGVKDRLLALTPANYIGLAPELARM